MKLGERTIQEDANIKVLILTDLRGRTAILLVKKTWDQIDHVGSTLLFKSNSLYL